MSEWFFFFFETENLFFVERVKETPKTRGKEQRKQKHHKGTSIIMRPRYTHAKLKHNVLAIKQYTRKKQRNTPASQLAKTKLPKIKPTAVNPQLQTAAASCQTATSHKCLQPPGMATAQNSNLQAAPSKVGR